MVKTLSILILLGLAVMVCSCGEDDEGPTSPAQTTDTANGTVTTEESAVIETPAGAQITIPLGAIPRAVDGSTGTMIVSAVRTSPGRLASERPDGVSTMTRSEFNGTRSWKLRVMPIGF